jgi:hypothetical protein
LLHGNLAQAAAYNALFLLLLAGLTACGLHMVETMGKPRRAPAHRLPHWSAKVLLVITVAYWILRNIDYPPFNLLAPHRLQ